MREVLWVLEVRRASKTALPASCLTLLFFSSANWETALDATAALMNQLARRLGNTRRKALEQIKALGWPVDIYHDIAWYPDLPSRDEKVTRSRNMPKKAARAGRMRDSILEIDVALAALNHFAETNVSVSPSSQPDAIVEALEASINAIEALLTSDADIGRRQREHGSGGGWTKDREKTQQATYKAWVEEDDRLQTKNPRLTKSARAKRIAEIHNARPENSDRHVNWETVRSALRRLRA
jgi:hypothetical protein